MLPADPGESLIAGESETKAETGESAEAFTLKVVKRDEADANGEQLSMGGGPGELDLLVEDTTAQGGLIETALFAREEQAPAFEYVEKAEIPTSAGDAPPSTTAAYGPTSPDEALGACLILTRSEALFIWEQLESAIVYARKTSGVDALRRTIELISHGAALNAASGSEQARRCRQDAVAAKRQLLERQRLHLRLLNEQANDVLSLLGPEPAWMPGATDEGGDAAAESRSLRGKLASIQREIKSTKEYVNALKMTITHLEGQLKCSLLLDDTKEAKLRMKHFKRTELQASGALVAVEKLLKALLWARRKERHIVLVRDSLEKDGFTLSRSVRETLDRVASEYDMAEHFTFLHRIPRMASDVDSPDSSSFESNGQAPSTPGRLQEAASSARRIMAASPGDVAEALHALVHVTPKRNFRTSPKSTPESARGLRTPPSGSPAMRKKQEARTAQRIRREQREQELLQLIEKQRREIDSMRQKEYDMKNQIRLLRKAQRSASSATPPKAEAGGSPEPKAERLASPPDSAIDRDAAYKVNREMPAKFPKPVRYARRHDRKRGKESPGGGAKRGAGPSEDKTSAVPASPLKEEQVEPKEFLSQHSLAESPLTEPASSPPQSSSESAHRAGLTKADLGALVDLQRQLRTGTVSEDVLEGLKALPLEGGFQLCVYVDHARSLPSIKKTSKSADTYVRVELFLEDQGPLASVRTDTEWDTVYPKWRQRVLLPDAQDVGGVQAAAAEGPTPLRFWQCGSGSRGGWLAPDLLAKCTLVLRIFQDLKLGEENDQEICCAGAPVKDLLMDKKLVWLRVQMATSVPRNQRVRVSTDAAVRVRVGFSGPIMSCIRTKIKALQAEAAEESSPDLQRDESTARMKPRGSRRRPSDASEARMPRGEPPRRRSSAATETAASQGSQGSQNFFMQARFHATGTPTPRHRGTSTLPASAEPTGALPGAHRRSLSGGSQDGRRSSRRGSSKGRRLPWESSGKRDDLIAIEGMLRC